MRIHQSRTPVAALIAAAIAFGASACAPLAQAPLVYSSKLSGGLDLSATSTESPGLSLNLGYKSVDAAYVPVAVSQQCAFNGSNAAVCDPSKLPVQIVRASNSILDSNRPADQAQESAGKAVADADAILQNKTADFDSKKATFDADTRKAADLDLARTALAQINAVSNADPAAKKTVQDRVDAAQDAQNKIQADTVAFQSAQVARAAAQKEWDVARSRVQSELNSSMQNERGDAFSVFGSFNSKSDVAAKGPNDTTVGLGVGKVFSTGLASQYLTENIKTVYVTNCLDAANKAVDKINASTLTADQKNSQIGSIYSACRSDRPTSLRPVVQ
jgi:hypothetical protein